ncbi:MAG: hypothetical protein QXW37_01750 [Candidatus Nitrosotenuis sp.]
MNIYDTRQIYCSKCGKPVGEVAYDAEIILPKCGICANPLPHSDDRLTINNLPGDDLLAAVPA